MAEEELRLKLEQATTYEERAAIRKELRKLKQSGSAASKSASAVKEKSVEKAKRTTPLDSRASAKGSSQLPEGRKVEKTTSVPFKDKDTQKIEERHSKKAKDSPTVVLKKVPKSESSTSRPKKESRLSEKQPHLSSTDGREELSDKDLQQSLALYINRELAGIKSIRTVLPVPRIGSGFYKACSNPLVLCHLVNLAVRNTIDIRALSSGSQSVNPDASDENLTLALESARSIGCFVDGSTHKAVVQQKEDVILNLLVDLLKARVVHSQSAEKLGRRLYDSPALLLQYFGIHL